MVTIERVERFLKAYGKLDHQVAEKARKLIQKIMISPEIGKPMRYARKGTREVYLPPFRISYEYLPEEDKIIFLDIYHKDVQ